MASQDVLSQTLSSITAIKLDQLKKQKDSYRDKKSSLLKNAASQNDSAKRTDTLLQGACKLLPGGPSKPELSNLDVFIEQSEFDPSVSEAFLKDTEDELRSRLDAQSNKYEFASLYGKLVEEWIASGKEGEPDAVVVGREEMHQQRATWEEYVFSPKKTDAKVIRAYLDDVFSSKETLLPLEAVRDRLKKIQEDWDSREHFDADTLTTCIKGMLRSDILNEEKRATMRDFLGNKVVLSELADVLNVRLSHRDSWSWDSPLVVEQRRNLNGRYRFYTDEDLLHSIFIYYIGLRFAVELRDCLITFTKAEGVWKSDTKPISNVDSRRRQFFINGALSRPPAVSVQTHRDQQFRDNILLDQLPKAFEEVRGPYGDDSSRSDDTRKSHTAVVQGLLQQLLAEISMNTSLGRETTVIRSDFTWFGPSLPHSSIFAVLEFFGVDAEWLDFFKRILEAPIRFKDDSADTPNRTRKRGTPVSTPIADVFGESLLFCLDFAVNQKADGTRLYRLHDDIWLWGGVDACAKAWGVITEFKDMMGLEINEDKTGSACISKGNSKSSATTNANLPKGDVKWGFLQLNPATGRFVIRQDEVDKHIEELRLQLNGCRSVLDFVQAWNTYGYRFFINNFGKPSQAYGRAHMDSMLATFKRIQEALSPGGVGGLLKNMIASRFGLSTDDIPDGFLYYPTSLGGLGLQNPFISVLLRRSKIAENPDELMERFHKEEALDYHLAAARYNETKDERTRGSSGTWWTQSEWDDLHNKPFMSLEEFSRYAERTSTRLWSAYEELISEPYEAVDVEPRGDVRAALTNLRRWNDMSAEEKWVVQVYHKDIIRKFGGLSVVDEGLLPTGLITMLRESRFQWQG